MTTTRRTFVIHSVVGAGAFAAATVANAQAKPTVPPMVDEKDTQAVALGYKADATTVDTKKYPAYAKGKNCEACALYQGKPKEAAGPCPLFAGKQVSAKGWCVSFAAKPVPAKG